MNGPHGERGNPLPVTLPPLEGFCVHCGQEIVPPGVARVTPDGDEHPRCHRLWLLGKWGDVIGWVLLAVFCLYITWHVAMLLTGGKP